MFTSNEISKQMRYRYPHKSYTCEYGRVKSESVPYQCIITALSYTAECH